MTVLWVTPSEHRVLTELLTDGCSNKEIGRRLFVSEDTIKTHMKRIYSRAEVPNRTALAVRLLRGDLRIEMK